MRIVLLLVGCSPDPGRGVPGAPPPTACPPSDELRVVSATSRDGRLSTDRELLIELSRPSPVAVLCTDDADPEEQHLVESVEATRSHALRLQGLAPDRTYTCDVAPTCPRAETPPRIALTTGPPLDLPSPIGTVDAELGRTGFYTLAVLEPGGGCRPGTRSTVVVYDPDGVARWWLDLPQGVFFDVEARFDPSDGTLVWGGGATRDGAPHVVDPWTGDAWVLPDEPTGPYHHDGKRLADGTFLTLSAHDDTNGALVWTGYRVRRHDPDGTVIAEYSSQRAFDEGWLPEGQSDPYHANWMDLVAHPDGERVFVSHCHDRSILAIDAATGGVLYKVANDGTWTVIGPSGPLSPDEVLPQCQHGLEVTGDDRLLVYDNGRSRDASQITELIVDPTARTIELAWQWTEPDWFEGSLGDVDDLGNGRVLVTQGHPECWSDRPGDVSSMVEVDRATGRVASRLQYEQPGVLLYRSERYDGCALYHNLRACPALRARAETLANDLGWVVAVPD